jgi:hypothetical protein
MKNGKPIKLWTVVLLASASAILLASSLLVSQDTEKICPISFGLYPGTKLETSCAARIEQDNVRLSAFLSVLRMNEDLGSYREAVRKIYSAEMLPEQRTQEFDRIRNLLNAWRKYKYTTNPFSGTYLEDPKLTTEEGVTISGLENVIAELARIVSVSTYVDAQSVRVELEYLPFKSEEFTAANDQYQTKGGEPPVDMIAHIKTVLAYAPKDAPVKIEGLLPHRTICFDRE